MKKNGIVSVLLTTMIILSYVPFGMMARAEEVPQDEPSLEDSFEEAEETALFEDLLKEEENGADMLDNDSPLSDDMWLIDDQDAELAGIDEMEAITEEEAVSEEWDDTDCLIEDNEETLIDVSPELADASEADLTPMLNVGDASVMMDPDATFFFKPEVTGGYAVCGHANGEICERVNVYVANEDVVDEGLTPDNDEYWDYVDSEDFHSTSLYDENDDIYLGEVLTFSFAFYGEKGKTYKIKFDPFGDDSFNGQIEVGLSYSNQAGVYNGLMYRSGPDDDTDTLVIIGYIGDAENVVVPAQINGIPVRTIGDSAFEGIKATSIEISEGITHFQNYVMGWCNNLKMVSLPSTLFDIYNNPFERCTNLSEIIFPNGNSNFVAKDGFFYSSKGELLSYYGGKKDELHVPEQIKTIGAYALNDSDVKVLYLPAGTKSIFQGPQTVTALHTANAHFRIDYAGIPNTATVYAPAGGRLEQWCRDNNVAFVPEGDPYDPSHDIMKVVFYDSDGTGNSLEAELTFSGDYYYIEADICPFLNAPRQMEGYSLDPEGTQMVEYDIRSDEEDNNIVCFNLDYKEGLELYVIWETEDDDDDEPPHTHSYDNWTITTPATCTTDGVKIGSCSCGDTTTEIIPATGIHTPVTDPAVAATTTSTGLTEGSHCSVCGTVLVAQQTIPMITPPPAAPVAVPDQITVTKNPSIKKPEATTNKITINWANIKTTSKKTKAVWKKIKKTQIQCATDKAFKNIVKTTTVGKNKTKAAIKGLKKNTTYYVRVRYFDGTGYSKWSSVKKIKTKKK